MVEWQIINIPENNFSILIEGDVQSKKEVFAKQLLIEQLKKNNKVSLLSFNPNIHSQYLKEKCPDKANLIISKETVDALTEIGIMLSEVIDNQVKLIYSDIYNILTTKNPPDMILRAYNFNIKKMWDNKVYFIETIDPANFNETNLSKLEALFDIIITLKHSDNKFLITYKKHPVENSDNQHEFQLNQSSISKDSLYELYKTSLQSELVNIGLYGKNFELFRKGDMNILYNLAKSSIFHATKLLDLMKERVVQKENISKDSRLQVLREGLKEEVTMKEIYLKVADQTEAKDFLLKLSNEEKIHENRINEIMKRVEND
ncbi:hypothetical protein GF327_01420 [Candidatus Woesearchaeota archaeon]|nr:hypothetical protein [Candidatus Woesearchaeota archaeon]